MTEEELKELERLEGPNLSLTPKPLIDMTNEELEAFVTRIRDCTTQHQTMMAHNKIKDVRNDEANQKERELFE